MACYLIFAMMWNLLAGYGVVAPLALLHFFWMRTGKNNFAEVWVYAAVLSALMGWRLWWWRQP